MNNSKIAIHSLELEEQIDLTPALNRMETDLIEIVEALEHINESKYWKMLVEKIFNKDLSLLSVQLENEKNPTEIYRLQGEIRRAKKLDLAKQLQVRKGELQRIKEQKNGNN